MARRLTFARVPGVRLGHATSPDGASGVTVVRFDRARPVVVDVRGGASATYDIASLALDATFGRRWAIFLSGGSLYGLDAARGVRTRILEEGEGETAFASPTRVVPIAGASIFDLPVASEAIPDYLPLGYEATRVADRSAAASGRVGAGAGATVGKYLGRARAMRGGLASAAARVPRGGTVGVLVVVNAVGAVRDPRTGAWVAGAHGRGGRISPPRSGRGGDATDSHTTLAIVVTDLAIGRSGLQRIAANVSTGLARVIVPFHTSVDGDLVFAASTEQRRVLPAERRPGALADRIGTRAAELAAEAAVRAVRPSA
ncbi:MAG: P1 family peptidase [Thermoplasmata archaeon]